MLLISNVFVKTLDMLGSFNSARYRNGVWAFAMASTAVFTRAFICWLTGTVDGWKRAFFFCGKVLPKVGWEFFEFKKAWICCCWRFG